MLENDAAHTYMAYMWEYPPPSPPPPPPSGKLQLFMSKQSRFMGLYTGQGSRDDCLSLFPLLDNHPSEFIYMATKFIYLLQKIER